jgi:aconitate hydratase
MGGMPLEFMPGENMEKRGLSGRESYSVLGIHDDLRPGEILLVRAVTNACSTTEFKGKIRIDAPAEMTYYPNWGILHTVMRQMLSGNEA